jgi:hypothetical protein
MILYQILMTSNRNQAQGLVIAAGQVPEKALNTTVLALVPTRRRQEHGLEARAVALMLIGQARGRVLEAGAVVAVAMCQRRGQALETNFLVPTSIGRLRSWPLQFRALVVVTGQALPTRAELVEGNHTM